MIDLDDYAIRRPPDLLPGHFSPSAAVAKIEILRSKAPGARLLAQDEHVLLVLAEAWLAHLDGVYVSRGGAPFRGDVDAYIERLVADAAGHIQAFLSARPPVWWPKARHPRFGGRLH